MSSALASILTSFPITFQFMILPCSSLHLLIIYSSLYILETTFNSKPYIILEHSDNSDKPCPSSDLIGHSDSFTLLLTEG